MVKESSCQCRRCRFNQWVEKIPWSRKWQPIPVFLPEKFRDRGAWQATVHGVEKNQKQLSTRATAREQLLKDLISHTHTHTHTHNNCSDRCQTYSGDPFAIYTRVTSELNVSLFYLLFIYSVILWLCYLLVSFLGSLSPCSDFHHHQAYILSAHYMPNSFIQL